MTKNRLDVTDKLTFRAHAASERFNWPAPPGYEYALRDRGANPGDCALIFNDGAKAKGRLLEFLPDESLLKFQQTGTDTGLSIGFSSILGLNLLPPVALRREAFGVDTRLDQQVFVPSERQPFSIELVTGNFFSGETVGYVHALCGLFIFQPDAEGVIRGFVPAAATRSYTIGKPIGQLLVDQNLASPQVIDEALQKQQAMRGQRLGEYLTENRIVSQEQLEAALRQQRAQPIQKLGEALVALGHLTPAQLDDALMIASRNRSMPLGQILQEMGVVDAGTVTAVMAKKMGIPYIDLEKFHISPSALKRIPQAVAQRHQILPIAESENSLVVAIDSPKKMANLEEVRFVAGMKLIPVLASAEDIAFALKTSYAAASPLPEPKAPEPALRAAAASDADIGQLTARLSAQSGAAELDEQEDAPTDSILVQLVNRIILDAVEQGASDIHVETNAGGQHLRVRFRKDGVLVTYRDLPSRFRKAVISRIKIMARLDITERRRPQDGKIEFARPGSGKVELRIATIPTANGLEDLVIRVLSAAVPVALDQLGLDAESLAAVKLLVSRSHGLLLVCGPTGSGKTTSVHSLLSLLNTSDVKIWTAEDPIEIVQAGLRQVQVNPKLGWTFGAAMRAFMRGDPDVIMVGEMRDAETAKTGIEASLTGHLVLSTLHTSSAPESVVRLLELGMDPFNFADSLLGVLAQRLVRRLCPACRTAYVPAASELEELALEYCAESSVKVDKVLQTWRKKHGDAAGRITLFRATGCGACDRLGYKGRIGLFELLVADAGLKKLIRMRSAASDITAAAIANGMRTLKQDGIEKVVGGITDIQQVRSA